jgi:hypothetical protein
MELGNMFRIYAGVRDDAHHPGKSDLDVDSFIFWAYSGLIILGKIGLTPILIHL